MNVDVILNAQKHLKFNVSGEQVKVWILEAWRGCSHKKIVAASAVTAFWNLTSIKTRIFAGIFSFKKNVSSDISLNDGTNRVWFVCSIHMFGDLSMA